jgi:hypothetical protein
MSDKGIGFAVGVATGAFLLAAGIALRHEARFVLQPVASTVSLAAGEDIRTMVHSEYGGEFTLRVTCAAERKEP